MSELSDYFEDIGQLPLMPWQVSIRHLICIHRLRQEIQYRAKSEKSSWRREANLKTIEGIRRLICEGNLRLVVACVKNLETPIAIDLVAEGNLGLLSAVDSFDIYRKCRFSTYAVYIIKTQLRNWANSQSLVLKRGASQRVGSLVKAQQGLSIVGNHNPTDQEIADWLNENGAKSLRGKWKSKYIATLKSNKKFQTHLSLEGPAGDYATLGDIIPDKKQMINETQSDIKLILKCLKRHVSARDADIIYKRFYYNTILKEIGDDLDITRERVRQIEIATLERVRVVFMCHRDSWIPLVSLVGSGGRLAIYADIARWLSYPDPLPPVVPVGADLETEDLPAAECAESLPTPVECLTSNSLELVLVPCRL